MEIQVRDDRRLVAVWLSRAETREPDLKVRLLSLCQNYRARRYQVAVFCSGAGDLREETGALLRRNRLLSVGPAVDGPSQPFPLAPPSPAVLQ